MYGFHGQLLQIDLTRGCSSWRALEEARLRAFLGGVGLGTALLHEYAPPQVEPFSPHNPLILTSAPLVGLSMLRIMRDSVVLPLPDSPIIVKISGLAASI